MYMILSLIPYVQSSSPCLFFLLYMHPLKIFNTEGPFVVQPLLSFKCYNKYDLWISILKIVYKRSQRKEKYFQFRICSIFKEVSDDDLKESVQSREGSCGETEALRRMENDHFL